MAKTIYVVAAMIMNGSKILIAKRQNPPKLWEFPGGKIEEGESKEQALMREIKEELSCEIEIKEHVGQSHVFAGGKEIYMDLFSATIRSGEIQLNDHDAIQWIEVGQLNNVEWAAADIPLLADVETYLQHRGE